MYINFYRVRGDNVPQDLVSWLASEFQWEDQFAVPVEHCIWVETGEKVDVKELMKLLQEGKYPQYGSNCLKIRISDEAKLFLSELDMEVGVVRLGEIGREVQFGIEAVVNNSEKKHLNVMTSYGCKIRSVWKEVEYDL